MSLDPVTDYAQSVTTGAVVASRLVGLACRRHLTDVAQQQSRGLVWKPDEAQRAIDFFAEVLCLPEETDADERATPTSSTPQPFILQPWQQFIVGSAFGWYTASGFRRFRQLYIEIAKGNGKTPLGAGMMLYLLVADGERGAQIFAAAVGRDQAGIAFRDAVRMVDASPHLRSLIDQRVNNLAVLEDGSFFRPVSSEHRGLDGKRVHGALIDELHEHPTPVVVNKMRAGTKGRRNAMIVEITNSGYDRTSVCWNHHTYARKVLEGVEANEAWFAFVAGLDPCDRCRSEGKWFPSDDCDDCDDWRTEGPHWLKANPNLGVSLPWQYVRERVHQARAMPSEVSDVLRFNFCVWTQAISRAISMERWAACQPFPVERERVGVPVYGAFDLGETDDFTAWCLLWPLEDGRVAVKLHYWVPEIALTRYTGRQYDEWQRAGLLTVTPGDVTDYATVRARIIADCQTFGVVSVGYDTKSARETSQLLIAEGIDVIPVSQGFPLNEAIKRTLELVTDGQLCHGDNLITTWMASNLVLLENPQRQRRIAKERAPEKVDGMAAIVMAVEVGLVRNEDRAGKASDPEVLFL